jgi:hypothetical protein
MSDSAQQDGPNNHAIRIKEANPSKKAGKPGFFFCVNVSDADDVGCLGSLGTFGDVKCHFFAFVEGFEAIFLDFGKMCEHIVSVFARDESIAFFGVEPFYFALHVRYLLIVHSMSITV